MPKIYSYTKKKVLKVLTRFINLIYCLVKIYFFICLFINLEKKEKKASVADSNEILKVEEKDREAL